MSDHPDPDPASHRKYGPNVKSGKDPKGERQDHDAADDGIQDESIRPLDRPSPDEPHGTETAKGPVKSADPQKAKFAEQERTASTGGTLGAAEIDESEAS